MIETGADGNFAADTRKCQCPGHCLRVRRTSRPCCVSRYVACWVFALSVTAIATGVAPAQEPPLDKVVLQLKGSSSRIALSCTVLDYTGEKITVRTKQGSLVRSYDRDEVVEVSTPQTENHVKGLVYFAQGEIDRAVAAFERALIEETRGWVRRDILALLVRCALRRGDYATAGSRFLAVWESDPTTRHFRLIPLTWSPRPLDAGLRNEALGWLVRQDEAARLMAASHLLGDTRHGPRAEHELDELSSSTDRRIRLLARAQVWRLKAREGGDELTPTELKRWHSRIEDLPEELRGGPYYVLGRGHLARKEYDRAAMALLWVPLVYDHDTLLAARACLEAADCLARIGRTGQAASLYREVTTRFAGTPYAEEAASLLTSISTDTNGGKP